MEDHLAVRTDRLLIEPTQESAMDSRNSVKQEAASKFNESMPDFSYKDDYRTGSSPVKLVECRICLDEDSDSSTEAPCSCNGSLKYAHRRCVQKWCNEKGDTTCEICLQQFKPGYTAPPPIIRLPMNLRGNWPVARRDYGNRRIVAVVSTDPTLHVPDYSEYAAVPTGSQRIVMCRAVATMFTILLIVGHILSNINRDENYPFQSITMLMLRIAGIIMSACILLKAVTSVLHHNNR